MAGNEYGSKVDAWLIAVGIAAGLASINALLSVSRSGSAVLVLTTVIVAAATCGLLLWVLFGTCYRFEGGDLQIASGPFRWRIKIGDITSVKSTRSPLSSPALSLDRLCIEYGDPPRRIMISPRERSAFLNELDRRRGA